MLIVQLAQAELNGGRSVIEAYSVLYHPDYLWNPTFYTDLTVNIIGFAFSPLLGVAIVGAAIWTATKPGSLRVVGIWFLAGLAIPLAFPRGADAHFYYFWGALAPGAILTAVAVVAGSEWVSEQSWGPCGVTELHYVLVTSIGVIVLLLVSSFVVGPAGLGVPPQDRASQITEGETVRDAMVYANANDEDVIVVTDLPVYTVESGESAMVHAYLMYSDLAFGGPDSPMAAPTVDQAKEQGARVIVNLQDSFAETKQPGRLPRILVCDNDGCVKFET